MNARLPRPKRPVAAARRLYPILANISGEQYNYAAGGAGKARCRSKTASHLIATAQDLLFMAEAERRLGRLPRRGLPAGERHPPCGCRGHRPGLGAHGGLCGQLRRRRQNHHPGGSFRPPATGGSVRRGAGRGQISDLTVSARHRRGQLPAPQTPRQTAIGTPGSACWRQNERHGQKRDRHRPDRCQGS